MAGINQAQNETVPEPQEQGVSADEESHHTSDCYCAACQIAGGSDCTTSYALLDDM